MSGFLLNSYIMSSGPVNLTVPVISGTTQEGNTLSTTTGTWSGDPTSYSYQWKRNGSNISGATSSSYTLVSADVGTTISVTVTAINATASTAITSDSTASIIIAAPVNTALPTISGTTYRGQTLTGSPGTWTNSPTSYNYRWRRNGSLISGATSTQYVLTVDDIGSTITFTVIAYNDGGSTASASSATATITIPPPSLTLAPALSGTDSVGGTLTTTIGTWTDATSYTYKWYRYTGTPYEQISGATSSTYTVTSSDIGYYIRAEVTATNSTGSTSSYSSNSTSQIAQPAPVNTALPTISGVPQRDQTLTVSTGTWSNSPTSYTYQWKRGGSDISGATSSSYKLLSADVGYTITVRVTATNSGGSQGVSSNPTATVVIPAPSYTTAPRITGTTQQGYILSCSTGTWSDASSYAYQWYRSSSTAISGATSSTYTLTSADIGYNIFCRVTASNTTGSTAAYTLTTATIAGQPPGILTNPTLYSNSGNYAERYVINAATNSSDWSNSPTSFSFQWQRGTPGMPQTSVNISGATQSIYTPTASDVGYAIRCAVTASNSYGNTVALTSQTSAIKGSVLVNVSVVAGGGGGGNWAAGGGGGGGGGVYASGNYAMSTGNAWFFAVKGTSYGISVGAGGAVDSNGSDSSAFGITATGGGRGASGRMPSEPGSQPATSGGAGGGGSRAYTSAGNGITYTDASGDTTRDPQSRYRYTSGKAGGTGLSVGGELGGGGGGAMNAGGNATASNGGSGGGGNTLVGGYQVGGGGGGGAHTGTAGGAGGSGGGATAPPPSNTDSPSGTPNTGGGGAGASGSQASGWGVSGGAGGSGTVVVYVPSDVTAASTSGTVETTPYGSYKIYKFNSSGSITF